MAPSEDRADVHGADTAEKPHAPEEAAVAEPSDAAEHASTDSVPTSDAPPSTPVTGERTPPKEAGKEPAGPSEEDPAELKERLLRVLAEQQNLRRRLERERDDAVRFAATQLIKDLLQTADNLSRALHSVPSDLQDQNGALRNLLAGVAASERALQDTFAKHGIRRIEPALGETFDPNQHQAMFEVDGSEWEPGTIAQIVLPGYAYHERLIRPAFVGVARTPDERPEATHSTRS
jgi:molecular chaperone GrpE